MSLARYTSLIGGDYGVYQTVSELKSLISQALTDPNAAIRLRAESLLAPTAERDELAEVSAIFYFVQNALHYVDDPAGIELLKNPMYMDNEVTQQGYFMGDCDDASGYLAALLKAVGYIPELVIVTPEAADSFDYRHIFVRVWLPKEGAWLSLDPTAKGQPLGWEVPNKKERAWTV